MLSAEEKKGQNGQHKGKGGGDGQLGGGGGEGEAVGEEGEDGGGVVVHRLPGHTVSRLLKIDGEDSPQRLAQHERGGDGEKEGKRESEKLMGPELSSKPEGGPEGNEEDGLQLKGKGEGQQDQRGDRLILQSAGKSMEAQGGPDTVALPPAGAVEDHGGQQEKGKEGDEPDRAVDGASPCQTKAAPGQKDIKKDGEELNAV